MPCGKCYACKLKKANDWQIRLKQEYLNNGERCIFVTLTYEDDRIPQIDGCGVVSRRDIQLFHKRLRHDVGSFTYFLVAEYGPTTLRPHYHGLYFGLDLSAQKYITKHWHNGFNTVSLVTPGRIQYVAKYSLIPISIPDKLLNLAKPFMICSKGIGIQYLQNPAVHRMHNIDDKLYYNDNGYKKSLPRYYRQKLFSEEKRKQFAEDYRKRSHQQKLELHKLMIDNPREFQKLLKRKKDWVYSHSYDVENRILKKPKL